MFCQIILHRPYYMDCQSKTPPKKISKQQIHQNNGGHGGYLETSRGSLQMRNAISKKQVTPKTRLIRLLLVFMYYIQKTNHRAKPNFLGQGVTVSWGLGTTLTNSTPNFAPALNHRRRISRIPTIARAMQLLHHIINFQGAIFTQLSEKVSIGKGREGRQSQATILFDKQQCAQPQWTGAHIFSIRLLHPKKSDQFFFLFTETTVSV